MKDKHTLRLISLGFLSGIIFSGFVFLVIFLLRSHSYQNLPLEDIVINNPQADQISTLPSSKLDLNQATVEQLEALPGIGEAKAAAIIDFREKYGDFEDITELTYVSGIGIVLLKSIQDLVIIN